MLLNVPLLECKVVRPKRTVTAKFWPFLTKFICCLHCASICVEINTFKDAKQWECNLVFFFLFFNLRDSICGIKLMKREHVD
jgi:hypothetical protein